MKLVLPADTARARENSGDGSLSFKPDEYEEWELRCKYVSVKTRYDHTIIPQTPGARVSRAVSNCEGEGCSWREEMMRAPWKGLPIRQAEEAGSEDMLPSLNLDPRFLANRRRSLSTSVSPMLVDQLTLTAVRG
jgi:hypothetical protein